MSFQIETTLSDHTTSFTSADLDAMIELAKQASEKVPGWLFEMNEQMYGRVTRLEKELRMPRSAIAHSRYMKQLRRKKITRRQYRSTYRRVKSGRVV